MRILCIILIVASCFLASFSLTRPTNEWQIIFNDNQSTVVNAESVDEALDLFRRKYKKATVYSVSQRSYVESVWIWK